MYVSQVIFYVFATTRNFNFFLLTYELILSTVSEIMKGKPLNLLIFHDVDLISGYDSLLAKSVKCEFVLIRVP